MRYELKVRRLDLGERRREVIHNEIDECDYEMYFNALFSDVKNLSNISDASIDGGSILFESFSSEEEILESMRHSFSELFDFLRFDGLLKV